jgi:flagellar M-ring protein FliF
VESTEEAFDHERQALRSEQVSEQRSRGSALVGGVPGALTNQPPEGGALEPGAAGGGGNESSNRTATRNYEVDRTIRHVRSPGSVLRRLSVAVVVDEPLGTDAEGNPRPEPLSEAQLADLTALVKKAVGFTEERGDSVHLVTASFQTAADADLISDPPLWQQPWLWSLLKQLVGALVVGLLALGVLRQLFKAVPASASAALPSGQPAIAATVAGAGSGAALAAPDGVAPDRVQLSSGGQAIAGQLMAPGDYERQVARAQSLVEEDPRLAANLVREWIGYER